MRVPSPVRGFRLTDLAARATAVAMVLTTAAAAPPASSTTAALTPTPSAWSDVVEVAGSSGRVADVETVQADGRLWIVWVATDADGSHVELTRQSGGTWTSPTRVAGSTGAGEVEVVTDALGTVRLAWTADRRVRSVLLGRDGVASGAPAVVHRTRAGRRGTRPVDLRMSGNAGGSAALSWRAADDDEDATYVDPTVQVAVLDGHGRGRVRTLSSPGTAGRDADVFLDLRGRATAVWSERSGRGRAVWTAVRRPGESWRAAERLSGEGVRTGTPRLAGRSGGRLAVAYPVRARQRPGGKRGLAVRHWTRRNGWGPAAVTRGARLDSRVDLGLSRRGATAAFTDSGDRVRVVDVTVGGRRTVSRPTPRRQVFDRLRVEVNAVGDAVVAWDSVRGAHHPVQAVYRPDGRAWGPVVAVSPPQGDAFLAALRVGGAGQAAVLFSRRGPHGVRMRTHARPDRTRCQVSPRGIPSCGAYAGASYGSNTDPAPMESQAGRRLGVRRTFWQGSQVRQAVRTARRDIALGRVPWVSFKLPRSWESMAAGDGDAWVRDLVGRLERLDGPVWVAFHHEPENDGDIKAWRRMQERLGPMVRTAPNVAFTVITTGWNQWYGPSQYRIRNVWPATKVDVAGFDVYNFHLSRRKDGSLITERTDIKAEYFDRISAWAEREGVAWALAETGQTDESFAEDPGWMRRAFRQLQAAGGVAMTYFNTPLNNYGSSWPLSGRAKQRAWAEVQAEGQLR